MKHFRLGKKLFVALLISFAVLMLGTVVPAQADDGTFGSQSSPWNFNQGTISFTHNDASPYKGFFMLWTQNNTGTAWSGFDFSINSATSDAVFIDTATWDATHSSPNLCADWAFDGDCDPRSSYGVSNWSITNGGLDMNVTLNSTWGAGQTRWIRVYTDNTTSQNGSFNVSVTPVLVPEPISSSLFIVGAATLGYRRFRKSITA